MYTSPYPTIYKYYIMSGHSRAAGAWTRQWTATGPRPPGTAAPARVAGCRPTGIRATVAFKPGIARSTVAVMNFL